MEEITNRDDVTPNVMQHIQRLASTLNGDPLSVAAVDFDMLRTVTDGFNTAATVFLLVSVNDGLRVYMRDSIFDAIRMDNELLPAEARVSEQCIESRISEIWRQVEVRIRYKEKQMSRRSEALRAMLGLGADTSPVGNGEVADTPAKEKESFSSVKVIINNVQGVDDNRRIAMSGNNANYNENQIH
jgi:hypothetical protein